MKSIKQAVGTLGVQRKRQGLSKSKVVKKAWDVFSKYIRNKYAVDGYVICVTCGVSKPVAQMQAGHYKSSMYNATKFDERNVHPQCFSCNIMRAGNYTVYALYLTRRYGADILEELDAKTKEIKKFTVDELEEMIETWKMTSKQN